MPNEICRIVEDDLVTVRLDLNGLFAGSSGFRLAWIDEGATPLELTTLRGNAPGAALAQANPDLSELGLGLKSAEASLDALIALMRTLGSELQRGGIIEYRSRTRTASKFYRYLPTTIPALLHGDRHDHIVINQFRDERGFEVRMPRQPFAFLAPVTGSATAITNSALARDVMLSNPGNAESPVKLTVTPDGTAEVGAVTVAVRKLGNLTAFAEIYAKEAEAGTMLTNTAAAADADASGGNVALCTFATIQTLARRWKATWTHIDPRALEGRHTVMARYKQTGATKGPMKMQLRHGAVDINPLPKVGEIIELDWTDVGAERFVSVSLGDVVVAPGSDTLVIEIWAERVDGDFSLAIDEVWLLPADNVTTFSVPGQRLGRWGAEKWEGDVLEGTGEVKEERFRLNANGELAKVPPNAGFGLPAGVHVFQFEGAIRNPTKNFMEIGKLSLVTDPTGLATEVAATKIRSKRNRLYTRIRGRHRRRVKYTVGAAEADGAVLFQPRVTHTAVTEAGRRLDVWRIRHWFLKAFTNGQPLVVDASARSADAAIGTEPVFPAIMEGGFPMAPPGDSLWMFLLHDLTSEAGYDDIDQREVSLKSIPSRSGTVRIDVTPYITH